MVCLGSPLQPPVPLPEPPGTLLGKEGGRSLYPAPRHTEGPEDACLGECPDSGLSGLLGDSGSGVFTRPRLSFHDSGKNNSPIYGVPTTVGPPICGFALRFRLSANTI